MSIIYRALRDLNEADERPDQAYQFVAVPQNKDSSTLRWWLLALAVLLVLGFVLSRSNLTLSITQPDSVAVPAANVEPVTNTVATPGSNDSLASQVPQPVPTAQPISHTDGSSSSPEQMQQAAAPESKADNENTVAAPVPKTEQGRKVVSYSATTNLAPQNLQESSGGETSDAAADSSPKVVLVELKQEPAARSAVEPAPAAQSGAGERPEAAASVATSVSRAMASDAKPEVEDTPLASKPKPVMAPLRSSAATGNDVGSQRQIQMASNLSSSQIAALRRDILLHLNRKEYTEARQILDTIQASVGDNSPFFNKMNAFVLSQEGRLQEAFNSYERAIQLDEKDVSSHFNIALLAVKLKNYDSAKSYLAVASRDSQFRQKAQRLLANIARIEQIEILKNESKL